MVKKLTLSKLVDLDSLEKKTESFDVVILGLPIHKQDLLSPFNEENCNKKSINALGKVLFNSLKKVKQSGFFFIYGAPIQLIKAHDLINKEVQFRYWIAVDSLDNLEKDNTKHLKHNHIGILMLSKGKQFPSLNTKNTRVPYFACKACGKNVKDWGGKKHLMNVRGAGVSDVWRDFFKVSGTEIDPFNKNIQLNKIDTNEGSYKLQNNKIPNPILERLLSLVDEPKKDIFLIQATKSLISQINKQPPRTVETKFEEKDLSAIKNKVFLGDCIGEMEKLLKSYPQGIFDMVFADPPYNLSKDYKVYEDGLTDKKYLEWCDRWLELCVKLTKPTGSLIFINIPKWALSHAVTLNKYAYLQNWIVWDALSTPKGKIMPAHYALLYYTKSPNRYIYNHFESIDSPEYCLRSSCIKSRKRTKENESVLKDNNGLNNVLPISDIWWDISRIKHKKDRDDHPCQLPDKLMDRIIKMFSMEGDLIFDPFAGAGTTAIWAIKNKRNYFTIEIDPYYKEITEKKLLEVGKNGIVFRNSIKKARRSIYTKKWLELKTQTLAQELNRKPTLEEFIGKYNLNILEIENLYGDPKRVLKASRISLLNHSS